MAETRDDTHPNAIVVMTRQNQCMSRLQIPRLAYDTIATADLNACVSNLIPGLSRITWPFAHPEKLAHIVPRHQINPQLKIARHFITNRVKVAVLAP